MARHDGRKASVVTVSRIREEEEEEERKPLGKINCLQMSPAENRLLAEAQQPL